MKPCIFMPKKVHSDFVCKEGGPSSATKIQYFSKALGHYKRRSSWKTWHKVDTNYTCLAVYGAAAWRILLELQELGDFKLLLLVWRGTGEVARVSPPWTAAGRLKYELAKLSFCCCFLCKPLLKLVSSFSLLAIAVEIQLSKENLWL